MSEFAAASQRLAFFQNQLQNAPCAAEEPKIKTYVHSKYCHSRKRLSTLQQKCAIPNTLHILSLLINSTMESIAEERQKATFDVRELTYFLDGGEKFTKVR